MIISFKYKYIYIKNKKVSGSTIQLLLRKYLFDNNQDISSGMRLHDHEIKNKQNIDLSLFEQKNFPHTLDQHGGFQIIEKILHKDIFDIKDNFFIFCNERNSFDKTVSAFEFARKKTGSDGYTKKFPEISTLNSFFNFHKLIPTDWHRYCKNNVIMPHKIFQYDALFEQVDFLNDFFGVNINKEDLNNVKLKSGYRSKKDYHDYYTNDEVLKVNKFFKNEIKYFKYNY